MGGADNKNNEKDKKGDWQWGIKQSWRKDWNDVLVLLRADGLEPSADFLELIESEIKREVSIEEMRNILEEKCKIREQEMKVILKMIIRFDEEKDTYSFMLMGGVLSQQNGWNMQANGYGMKRVMYQKICWRSIISVSKSG